jgi:hypothetical protein
MSLLHYKSLFYSKGYKPDHECKNPYNSSNGKGHANNSMSTSFEKCSIMYTTNDTGVSIVSTTDCTDGWRYFDPEPYSEDRSFISEVSDKLLVCQGNFTALDIISRSIQPQNQKSLTNLLQR